jgi:arsenical-resistance protein 2
MAQSQSQAPQTEWWSAFPAPRATCPKITGDELMKLFDDMDIESGPSQFVLVDVRRTDWEVRNRIPCPLDSYILRTLHTINL